MEGYGNAGFILSTDDYFINDYGHYNFDYNQLGEAHAWNQDRAEEAMRDRVHPIIIDNTNIRRRHMKPYVQMGLDYGYFIRFMETPDYSVDELHERYPGIDKQDLYRMKRNYEPAETIYDVLYDISGT
ncbi:NEDD4-binding protein 2-like 1 isoform X3 [Conger conger]|nr:NEDD4-binding protein 2-like 1 isoform X3 [Conger conger]